MKKLLLIAVCLAAHFTLISQTIVEQLEEYNNTFPQEKVYVSTDRNTYVVGENIWFVAHLRDATTHKASAISSIIYVEFVDPQTEEIIYRRNLSVSNGFAKGDFELAEDLPLGKYILRGYSKYMKNFGSEFLFQKPIYVIATQEREVKKKNKRDVEVDTGLQIQFFPEGGELVTGIQNKIAFKAMVNNVPAEITGKVVNTAGETVAQLKTQHMGMGLFILTPGNTNLTAVVEHNGVEKRFTLPEISATGYGLEANLNNDVLGLTLRTNGTSLFNHRVVGHTRGTVLFSLVITENEEAFSSKFSTESFPSGVLHVTLFDAEDRPLAERLLFVNNEDLSTASLKLESEYYKASSEVSLTPTFGDNGVFADGNYSLTVVDNKFSNENNFNILSYLLLTSDLKGSIQNPDFYFDAAKSKPKRSFGLDLVMRTHGWSKFTWKQVKTKQQSLANIPEIDGYNLTYQLYKSGTQKPVTANVQLTSLTPLSSTTGRSLSDGSLNFIGFNSPDTTIVFLKANYSNSYNVKGGKSFDPIHDGIRIESIDNYAPVQLIEPNISPVETAAIDLIKDEMDADAIIRSNYFDVLIEAVKIDVRAEEDKKRFERASRLYGQPTARVLGEKFGFEFGTVVDMIRIQPAVTVTGNPLEPTVRVRGTGIIDSNQDPLFLLDGSPTELEFLLNYRVEDIDYVDVLAGLDASTYGPRGANGVVAVYLKDGASGSRGPLPGSASFKIPGYYQAREYYNPMFSADENNAAAMYSPTLHWEPEVTGSISFKTPTFAGEYTAILEGITTTGKPVVAKTSFNVYK